MRAFLALALLLLCSSAAMAQVGDACAVMPKNNVAISITTATTTSLIAPVTGQAIYICGVNLTMGASTSIQFEYGTGATCGVGTTALSGVIPAVTINIPLMNATQMVTPVSQRMCALSVGTNGIHGQVSFVQW